MSDMKNLVECTSWSRHHRSSPYEVEVTDHQESSVTIHGELVEAMAAAAQGGMKIEMVPAVPPWMQGGSEVLLDLDLEPSQDED